jgi:hypothetical protein
MLLQRRGSIPLQTDNLDLAPVTKAAEHGRSAFGKVRRTA